MAATATAPGYHGPMPGTRHIALVGPMGAGKSSIGRALATLMQRPFVDLDREIERQAGASVALIFELEGEAGFRRREQAALAASLAGTGQVIACGGGAVLEPGNRQLLRQQAFVVHLQVGVDEQLARLQRDRSRPLLHTPDRRARLQALARDRDPLYRETADLEFLSHGGSPMAVARLLLAQLPGAQSGEAAAAHG